jgi:hypothetical protein
MAQFTPDYEHLYMQEDLSDVTLAIRDENETTGAAGQKRKRKSTARTLPGHCVLLLGHSGYCKAKVNPTMHQHVCIISGYARRSHAVADNPQPSTRHSML